MKKILNCSIILAAACCLLNPFSSLKAQEFRNNSKDITQPFAKSADSILALGKVGGVEEIRVSLANAKMVRLKLPKANTKSLASPDIYKKAMKSTVIVGSAYLCPHCSNTHVNNATGYVIGEEGIVVTNYHVVKGYVEMGDGNKPLALLIRTADGKTYPVKEVINASPQNDLAVLSVDIGEDKLPALALSSGAQVGEDAYVLGHPRGMYYFFSKGIVNSKFQEMGGTQEAPYFYDMMAISADYAAGASGGPILDQYGNIIGTVSSTRTLQYSDPGKSVQMVLKMTIPVESLLKLINKG